jgi:hypothetical protein
MEIESLSLLVEFESEKAADCRRLTNQLGEKDWKSRLCGSAGDTSAMLICDA